MITENNITPVTSTKVKFFAVAKFPSLNKQDDFSDYLSQMNETVKRKVEIDEIITLSNEDFETFKTSLLDRHSWLEGKGGTNSTFELGREIENVWKMNNEEMEQWRKNAYNVCVMIQNEKGENILVDPQGYSYARYCGVIA